MKARRANGRPPIVPDTDQLMGLARSQCTLEECEDVPGVARDTIGRRLKDSGHGSFAVFFRKHRGEGRASLRRAQWKAAQAGNSTLLIWLGKQMLGQRDEQHLQHGGGDTPVRVVFATCYAKHG